MPGVIPVVCVFLLYEKNNAFSTCLLLMLASCTTVEKNTFVLNGSTDLEDGKKYFVYKQNAAGQPLTIDTATVDKENLA